MPYSYITPLVNKTDYIGNSLSAFNQSLTALDYNLDALSAYTLDNIDALYNQTEVLSSNLNTLSAFATTSLVNISALNADNGVATLSSWAIRLDQLPKASYEPTFISFISNTSASNFPVFEVVNQLTPGINDSFGTNLSPLFGETFPRFYWILEGVDGLTVSATLDWGLIDVPSSISNHETMASATNSIAHFGRNTVDGSYMLLSFQKGYTSPFT